MARNVVVIGTQWGDEGKGKIVDLLTEDVAAVARFQGGHNAGHTLIVGGEHDPDDAQREAAGAELHHRTAAADLDVVGVGTDAQHVAQARSGVHEVERDHDRVSFASDARSQTRHGGTPPAIRSSSVCLSRNVSMHCQKHASR